MKPFFNVRGALRAKVTPERKPLGPLLRIFELDEDGAECGGLSFGFYVGEGQEAPLIAAAINGELAALLEDLFEFCDDLGDGAPDSPPYAHRALNLAARLEDVLPKAPKPMKVAEPVTSGGGL